MTRATTLGQTIRAARLAAGLSQRALAEASGIHWNTIARYERDEIVPGFWAAMALRDAMDTLPEAVDLLALAPRPPR